MTRFTARRIKLGGITYDLDKPITSKVFYVQTRRKPHNQAVESLVKNGYLRLDKELRRQKVKEDAIIKALKGIGGVFVK